jgi:hypothetical protein
VHHYLLQAISICNLASLPCSSDKTTTSRSDPAIDLDDPVPGSMKRNGVVTSPSPSRPRTQKGPGATVICPDREHPAAAPEAQEGVVTFYGHAVDRRGPWARPRVEASYDPVPARRDRDLAIHLGGTRFITTASSSSDQSITRELRSGQWPFGIAMATAWS